MTPHVIDRVKEGIDQRSRNEWHQEHLADEQEAHKKESWSELMPTITRPRVLLRCLSACWRVHLKIRDQVRHTRTNCGKTCVRAQDSRWRAYSRSVISSDTHAHAPTVVKAHILACISYHVVIDGGPPLGTSSTLRSPRFTFQHILRSVQVRMPRL